MTDLLPENLASAFIQRANEYKLLEECLTSTIISLKRKLGMEEVENSFLYGLGEWDV